LARAPAVAAIAGGTRGGQRSARGVCGQVIRLARTLRVAGVGARAAVLVLPAGRARLGGGERGGRARGVAHAAGVARLRLARRDAGAVHEATRAGGDAGAFLDVADLACLALILSRRAASGRLVAG